MFQTDSPYILVVSGTGHAGMEAAIANQIEEDPLSLGKFLVRWNLQALGLPETAVAEGLAAIDQMAPVIELPQEMTA